MGDHIIGMKKMKEISATVKGANEHCTKVFQKSFGAQPPQKTGDPAPNPTETSDMDKVLMKSMLALDEAGRSYAAGLEDDACEAFLRKSREDQTAEVTKHVEAEKAKADAAAEEEKKKAAGDPEVEKLKSELAGLKSEREVEKAAARDRELKDIAKTQYPAVPKAYDTLKSLEKLDEADRAPMLAVLKSQQDLAKNLGGVIGNDDETEGSAKAKYDAVVAEVAKTKEITKAQAIVVVAEDPEHQQLVRDMRDEAREAAAA